MNNERQFFAPNGGEIRGTFEMVPGYARVKFDDDRNHTHSGGTECHWDACTTQSIERVDLFADYDGHDWLRHHLIPDEESLSAATLDLIDHELKIGEALKSARELDGAIKNLPASFVAPATLKIPDAIRELQQSYAGAKAMVIAAIERELAMREPA